MGVAALVLGIMSALICWIPFCNTWAIVPAIVGLILGIIDWVKKGKNPEAKKGLAIAGTICSGIAIIIIIVEMVIIGVAAKKTADAIEDYDWGSAFNSLENYDWNNVDWNE